MISRRATIEIAGAYHDCFTSWIRPTSHIHGPQFQLYTANLYDFLYAENFDVWLLNAFKAISGHSRGLKEFIMRLHTGESVVKATQDWTSEQRRALGQRILKELAESLIRRRQDDPAGYRDHQKAAVDKMQRALELYGYIYGHSTLLVPEQTVIEEAEEQGVLEQLFATVGLSDPATLRHHLELSVEHYHESRWDDSISNSRKVLEGVLQQAAARHGLHLNQQQLPSDVLSKPSRVRDYLETAGLLDKKEKEAVQHIYGLLSNTGGHPYVAERDQARLMRHLALTFSQFVLLRLAGALKV